MEYAIFNILKTRFGTWDGSLTHVDLMGKVVKSEPVAVVNDANM